VSTVLKPTNYEEEEYLYIEGEPSVEMFFIGKGAVAYVLPRFQNKPYLAFTQG
jgi:hypothetical protein